MSTRTHRHWRQPQVLVLEPEGVRAEFIGMHLKSKINRRKPFIDHMLFTQSLVNKNDFPRIEPGSGIVEHTIHETINAIFPGEDTSDHRPVSVVIRWS